MYPVRNIVFSQKAEFISMDGMKKSPDVAVREFFSIFE